MATPDSQSGGPTRTPPYERPPDEVVDSIRRHLADEHGHELRLRRDVWWGTNRARNPVVALEPADAMRPARFWCHLCGRGKFRTVGTPEAGPERTRLLRSRQPVLDLILGDLPEERHEQVVELVERGELGTALLDSALARKRQQVKRRSPHIVERRRRRAQQWMLGRYAEIGNVQAVQDELEAILLNPGDKRSEVLGEDRPRSKESLRKDWRAIPAEQREAAKKRYEARPEQQRRSELAARRARKPTG